MWLNQVTVQNMELEEENNRLKMKAHKSIACTVKTPKHFGDVIIKYSTNVNFIT
jgi:hypothetical protein